MIIFHENNRICIEKRKIFYKNYLFPYSIFFPLFSYCRNILLVNFKSIKVITLSNNNFSTKVLSYVQEESLDEEDFDFDKEQRFERLNDFLGQNFE